MEICSLDKSDKETVEKSSKGQKGHINHVVLVLHFRFEN